MIYSSIQVPPVLYMTQEAPNGSGHIRDHLNLELFFIHTCTWLCERDSKGGHCLAEYIDSHIILQPKGFK